MIIPAELIFKELFTLEFYCLSLVVLPEAPGRRGGGAGAAGEGGTGVWGWNSPPQGFLGINLLPKLRFCPAGRSQVLCWILWGTDGHSHPWGQQERSLCTGQRMHWGLHLWDFPVLPTAQGFGVLRGCPGGDFSQLQPLDRWAGTFWVCSRRGALAQQ